MKKILINEESWQTRVAITREEKLLDVYLYTHEESELERCFFKGKVAKVLPGIQTVFVDFGQTKAGFLHISEVDRALAAEKMIETQQENEQQGQAQDVFKRTVKNSMDVSKIFKEGENVLIQVIKEPIYEKGAKLTTCFTLPGKFVVLMPNIPQIGISKKIESRTERQRLKEVLLGNLPQGMGAIVRTTAEDRSEKDITKDLSLLVAIWKNIQKKYVKADVGTKIYQDLPITLRAVRDHLKEDVDVVLVDKLETQKAVAKLVKGYTPEEVHKIKLYSDSPPLFEKYKIDKQIEEALHKKVYLKSGGSIIVETAEAMSVIDVNTGRYTGKANLEETILKTNLEAAEEIVRQLRLRNIGGLIVIDFIDMASQGNRRKLSHFFEKTLKERDKYQSVLLKVSEFGLIQMTRKRSGKTLVQQMMHTCPTCNSFGYIKSPKTIGFEILKQFKQEVVRKNLKGNLGLFVVSTIFDYLIHSQFVALLELEKELSCKIILEIDNSLRPTQFNIENLKETK